MRSWTYLELKTKVELDLGIEDELHITDAEMLGYCNEAIDDAEAEIHQLNEGYFKTSDFVSLVKGTSRYDMPSDIYANKIKLVFYDEGTSKSDTYKVWRIKDKIKADVEDDDDYEFDVENDGTDGIEFVLYPPSLITNSTFMKRWYIRNAKQLTVDADILDIPEFANYIMASMKVKAAIKEGHPLLALFRLELDDPRNGNGQLQRMRRTLDQMIVDEEEVLEPDLSFYEEMS